MNEISIVLQELIAQKEAQIHDWFVHKYKYIERCFYSSVDIRDSGYKIVPVDTNLFPAGLNNLTPANIIVARQNVKSFFMRYYPQCNKILIIPENHTRNRFYLSNIITLKNILEQAGYVVEIAIITTEEKILSEITTNTPELNASQVIKIANKIITTNGFIPDIILLNTDLTSGVPQELLNIEQPIIPHVNYGWHLRTKSQHFKNYDLVLAEFCQQFGLDPTLLSALHRNCGKINFKEQTGIKCLAKAVDEMILRLQNEYDKYGITDKPYVYIKAERGTYGMGIMTATCGEEIDNINKKTRNKMDVIKEGVVSSEVIIQEGIKTINTFNGFAAEALSYLVDSEPIGYFFRFNSLRDSRNNLNSLGSEITSNLEMMNDN